MNINFKENFVFLLDKNNNWIEKRLLNFIRQFPKKFKYTITKDPKNIKNKNIFVISYTRILSESFLKKNKEVLIIHPSKLPLDRGFSPVQNQILRKKKKIFISIIKAARKVDTGPICIQNSFYLEGHELSDEIREKQAIATLKLIQEYLKKYPKVKFFDQKGRSTFNYKRKFKDNRIDINKSIKSQFNLLRIVNNDLYPANFRFKNQIYLLKIFKKK